MGNTFERFKKPTILPRAITKEPEAVTQAQRLAELHNQVLEGSTTIIETARDRAVAIADFRTNPVKTLTVAPLEPSPPTSTTPLHSRRGILFKAAEFTYGAGWYMVGSGAIGVLASAYEQDTVSSRFQKDHPPSEDDVTHAYKQIDAANNQTAQAIQDAAKNNKTIVTTSIPPRLKEAYEVLDGNRTKQAEARRLRATSNSYMKASLTVMSSGLFTMVAAIFMGFIDNYRNESTQTQATPAAPTT